MLARYVLSFTAILLAATGVAQTVLRVDADRNLSNGLPVDGLTWETAFPNLAASLPGINGIGGTVELWLAEGTYMLDGGVVSDNGFMPGSGDPSAHARITRENFRLLGGFAGTEATASERDPSAHEVVISGDLLQDDNGTLASRADNSSNSAFDFPFGGDGRVFDGLTFEAFAGAADRPVLQGSDALLVTRCTFRDNTVESGFAIAIALRFRGSIIDQCTFENCVNLNPPPASQSNPPGPWGVVFIDYGFTSSTQVYNVDAQYLSVTRSDFISCTGGVAANRLSGDDINDDSSILIRVLIANSRFLSPRAPLYPIGLNVGTIDIDTNVDVVNCLFAGTPSTDRPDQVIFYNGKSGSSLSMANCTFVGQPMKAGGAMIRVRNLGAGNFNPTTRMQSCILDVDDGTVDTIGFGDGGTTIDSFCLGRQSEDRQTQTGTPVSFLQFGGPDGIAGTADDEYIPAPGSPAVDASGGTIPDNELDTAGDRLDFDMDGVLLERIPFDVTGRPRYVDIETVADGPGAFRPTGKGVPLDAGPADVGAFEVPTCTECPGLRYWQPVTSGLFNDSMNWFPGVPGSGNTAVFDKQSSYQVAFGDSVQTAGLRVLTGDVTLSLNGSEFVLTDYPDPDAPGVPDNEQRGLVVAETGTASLTLSNGSVFVPVDTAVDVGLRTSSDGQLILDNAASLFVDEELRVAPRGRGTLRVVNGSTIVTSELQIGDPNSTEALVEVSGNGSFIDAIEGVTIDSGTLRITQSGAVFAGIPGFSGIFVKDGGSIEGDGIVIGNVLNRGEVSPTRSDIARGFAPSTLSIMGNYFQFDQAPSPTQSRLFSGRLILRVAGDGFGGLLSDTLVVDGNATFGGGLVIESPGQLVISDGVPLLEIISATSVTAGSAFDVVLSPVLQLDNTGTLSSGTLIPVTTAEGLAGVSLTSISLDELLFGSSEFTPDGTPNDAALGDVTGDGIDDLVIAVPTLTGSPQGAVALLRGENTGGFSFTSVDLYLNAATVDAPTAVEIGDFDNNGTREIAFGSGGDNGVSNDVHIIRFDGIGLTDTPLPAFDVTAGSVVVDLATSEGFFPTGGTGLAVLRSDAAPGSFVDIARYDTKTDDWGFCPLPVDDDDPDSVDPVDTDGNLAAFSPGVAVTTRGTNRLWVFIAQTGDPTPDDWDRLDFPTGDGPRDVRADDLDGDGIDDLVVINQASGTLSVLRTRAGGDIAPPVEIPASPDPISLTLVDLDDDGDRDVAIVADNGTGRVVRQLRNTTQAPGSITLAAAQDIPDQPNGTPVLIRSSDLDGSNGTSGIEDDLVILVEPGAARGGGAATHGVRLSASAAPCLPDVNGDGLVTPADFSSWILAFNTQSPGCDQNGDGLCQPNDFSSFILNYNQGCI